MTPVLSWLKDTLLRGRPPRRRGVSRSDGSVAAAAPGDGHAPQAGPTTPPPSTTPAPLYPPPSSIWTAVTDTYARATSCGAVCRTDTASSILHDGGWSFVLRSAAATLAAKDAATAAGRAGSPPPSPKPLASPPTKPPPTGWFNPFLPPDPDLVVFPAFGTLGSHALVLNKFNLAARHALIITSSFERQEAPLTPDDLAATWAVLDAYPGAGGLAYYNRGPGSGASQPHKHLQVVPLPLDSDGEAADPSARAPFERAVADATAAAALYEPVALTRLPFRAWGARLPGGRDGGGSQPTPQELGACVAALATAAGAPPGEPDWTPGEDAAAVRAGAGPGGQPTRSWNLVFTRRVALVVPRPPLDRQPGPSACLNGIGYAGSLYARGPGDVEAMAAAGGPMAVLAGGGVKW